MTDNNYGSLIDNLKLLDNSNEKLDYESDSSSESYDTYDMYSEMSDF